MVGDRQTRAGQHWSQLEFLPWSQRSKIDPASDLFLLQPEEIQQLPAELDALIGTVNPHFLILQHEAVDKRWKSIDVVRMDVCYQNCADLSGISIQFLDFLDDTPRTIHEHQGVAVVDQKRGVVPVFCRDSSPCPKKIDLNHLIIQARDVWARDSKSRESFIKKNGAKINFILLTYG